MTSFTKNGSPRFPLKIQYFPSQQKKTYHTESFHWMVGRYACLAVRCSGWMAWKYSENVKEKQNIEGCHQSVVDARQSAWIWAKPIAILVGAGGDGARKGKYLHWSHIRKRVCRYPALAIIANVLMNADVADKRVFFFCAISLHCHFPSPTPVLPLERKYVGTYIHNSDWLRLTEIWCWFDWENVFHGCWIFVWYGHGAWWDIVGVVLHFKRECDGCERGGVLTRV